MGRTDYPAFEHGIDAIVPKISRLVGSKSKQAADSAISILQSKDWKAAAIKKKHYQAASHRNPFAEDTEPPSVTNSIHDNATSNSSSLESENNKLLSCSVVEYENIHEHESNDDISPLHSSSERKKNSSSSSRTKTDPFDKSDLKKTSLSSISANSSSEHHVTTKKTSSSSMSRSSARQRTSAPLGIVPSSSASALSWDATDRRRFRTVVPSRVFMTEPCDFPNEDDSFSIPFNRHVVTREHGASTENYDSLSAPARQQQALPIVSPSEKRRHSSRSIMSSPH